MNFETVIGLEVHVELLTESKLFSSSPTYFGAEPNANTNAGDWAYPGMLPVMNKFVVEQAMKAALALNCEIAEEMSFDRKHYFYADLPQHYQITQDREPIGRNGYVDIEVDGQTRRIRINRVHIEQDAGKLTHSPDGSLVDFNRAGTPLVEIVTEADIRSPQEAYVFLNTLRETILFTGVSDVKMEEGSLRCDGNISLRPYGQEEFGTKSEIKNINSFNFLRQALEYEEVRQANILRSGGEIEMDTRRYDDKERKTYQMRANQDADDYRYFPDPDVPPMTISREWVEQVKETLPKTPAQRRKYYTQELGLPEYDAKVLTQTRQMADFFEEAVEKGANPNQASNWLMGEVSAHLNENNITLDQIKLTPQGLADIIGLIEDGTISSKIAKQIFEILATQGGNAREVVEEKGLAQISDPEKLQPIIDDIMKENQENIDNYLAGHDKVFGFFVGQVMKQTRGQANPQVVNKLIKDTLESFRD